MEPEVYDSAARDSYGHDLLALWHARRLIRLLARNNFLLRYNRSLLGVGWSLLNPLLQMLVYYVVFSHLFRFHTEAPYVAFVLSGLLVANLFQNVILAVAASAAVNAPLITRLRIPAEVFGLGQMGEQLLSSLVSLVPLAIILIVVGPGLAFTDFALLAIVTLLALFATGLGLLLAPLVALFRDTIQVTQILLSFVTYLVPIFYPFSIVPHRYRIIEQINPLYWYLEAVRASLFTGGVGSTADWAVMAGSAALACIAGTYAFSRARTTTLAALA